MVAIFTFNGGNQPLGSKQAGLGKRAGDLPVVSGPLTTTKQAVRYD